jgi:transcriptional regulator with XRE-family HTH domain
MAMTGRSFDMARQYRLNYLTKEDLAKNGGIDTACRGASGYDFSLRGRYEGDSCHCVTGGFQRDGAGFFANRRLTMARGKGYARGTLSFAAQLRTRRLSSRLTLEALARQSHVSKSMISKVERGDVQPSLDIAVRIAEALNSTLSEMVRHDDYARVIKIARKDQSVIVDPNREWERRLLSPAFGGTRLEMLYATVKPKAKMGSFPPHLQGTEEYIVVLRGELRISINGTEYQLRAGDSLFFEADKHHALENPAKRPAEYLIVIKH